MSGPVTIPPRRGPDVRIAVNPNAYHSRDPEEYIARFRDANHIPSVGDEVTVVQPDDDPAEPEFVSTAQVLDVRDDHGFIVLKVDWKGFHDATLGSPATVNYSSATLMSSQV